MAIDVPLYSFGNVKAQGTRGPPYYDVCSDPNFKAIILKLLEFWVIEQ
jgi:hypothetical protein